MITELSKNAMGNKMKTEIEIRKKIEKTLQDIKETLECMKSSDDTYGDEYSSMLDEYHRLYERKETLEWVLGEEKI